jgi:chemotaxis protein CheC
MDNIVGNREGSIFELTPFQKDALNKLCHITSSHAVTSLAELTGTTFDIKISSLNVIPIKDVKRQIGAEKIAAGILIKLEGSFSGDMYILFPERSAFQLVDVLLCKMSGETKSVETEMEKSALMETGNILASAFCDAVADLLRFSLVPSPPSFAFDMVGAMIESALITVAQAHETEHVILFNCAFQERENGIQGYMVLFPDPNGLKEVLSMLERRISEKN